MNLGPCFGRLPAHVRVLGIAHRGHGRGLPTPHFSLEQCADDAIAIAAARGAERSFAVGSPASCHARSVGASSRSPRRAVQVAYPAGVGLARIAPGLAREG
ncbi:MAG: hypothetical protein IPK00_24570 [Deltaproteobacteria bacterium]|nr:hypothetical protein [Deltaproteobacteria bacterium]